MIIWRSAVKFLKTGYGELYLRTEQSQNIYVYDSASGEDILAENGVNEIRIDGSSPVSVDQYVDGSIVAGGQACMQIMVRSFSGLRI